MDRFINLLYIFFWTIAFLVFIILSYKIYTIKDNSLYISAFAILISAFLASLSMIKSIRNSQLVEKNKTEKEKETIILHFEYLLILLLHKTKKFNEEFSTHIKRVANINNQQEVTCQKKLNLSNDFFFLTLIETKKQFNDIRRQLENQDLYKYIKSGNRMILVESCLKISELEMFISMLINSKSTSELLLKDFEKIINTLTSNINSLIKVQKLDIEKNHPSESLYTLTEYGDYKGTKKSNKNEETNNLP
ncbi:hypothetical protein [Sulfurimonas sp.]|jgi:hypothetical protein|uniref:hypothetical protein n=1 Tax=Sulfurimonas sp. TaxID=2022749 RepID=UPI002A362F66|nr:hypothetical protein [Sulfurimonas sp.]MDY0124326.1 hypothetical protein [Sulfurimonas sp.]